MFKKGYKFIPNFIEPCYLDIFYDILQESNTKTSKNNNFIKVIDPYLVCPEIIELALSKNVQDLATSFLGSKWGIGTCNLRKSMVTDIEEKTTTFFHRDDNSKNFIKMFFYLNDVDIDGGPFTYVEGSHINRREKDWTPGSRWTDEKIASLYGLEKIVHLTGKKGDLIVANTTGFHKGLKCRTKERNMLTINFTTEAEKFGVFKMYETHFKKLTEEERFRCRFMDLV